MTTTTTDPAEPETTTEEGPTTEPAETAGDDAGQDGTEPPEEGGRAARDAAKYRIQLRSVEAERDALVERVAALQRAQVEALAAADLSLPADLFDVGRVELPDLLDETGEVDAAAVAAAVAALVGQRPGLSNRPRLRPDLNQGRAGSTAPGGASWKGLISGRG